MTNGSLQIVVLLGTIAVACTVDDRVGGNPTLGDGGTVCRGAGLSPTCLATWEDASQTGPGCYSEGHIALGHSGELLARNDVIVARSSSICLYDPATHALVGGWRKSYVADFCNETSSEIYYGVGEPGRPFVDDIAGGPKKCPGPNQCRAPLGESTCAATWQEAQVVKPWWCTIAPPFGVSFGHAVGLLAVVVSGGFSVDACYYD